MAYRLSPQALKKIGTKIRKIRKSQDKKAIEVATEAGVEPSYYSKIEHGTAKPSLQKIHAICKALGISSKDILTF